MGRPIAKADYIRVHGDKYRVRARLIESKHPIFNGEVCVDVDDEKIVFTEMLLDDEGKKTMSFAKLKGSKAGWMRGRISDDRIPLQKMEIDLEESTEDRVVIYFEDLIE